MKKKKKKFYFVQIHYRIFKNEEIDFVKIVGKTIRTSMKKLKKKLLEKDRDIRIN